MSLNASTNVWMLKKQTPSHTANRGQYHLFASLSSLQLLLILCLFPIFHFCMRPINLSRKTMDTEDTQTLFIRIWFLKYGSIKIYGLQRSLWVRVSLNINNFAQCLQICCQYLRLYGFKMVVCNLSEFGNYHASWTRVLCKVPHPHLTAPGPLFYLDIGRISGKEVAEKLLFAYKQKLKVQKTKLNRLTPGWRLSHYLHEQNFKL